VASKRKALWDDDAFLVWVEEGVKERGLTISQVLKEAGVSRFYLRTRPEPTEGRSTNIVLNLAEILGRSPAKLFGLPDPLATDELRKALELWQQARNGVVHGPSDKDRTFRLERMRVAARVIAAQLATFSYATSDRGDLDPAVLIEMMMREVSKNLRHGIEPDTDDPVAEPIKAAATAP
jgi:hypothetical protein